ncbi:hypothetical protein CMV_002866 [Castanea mollissima]|uniref:Uncharacterized protein n=1 Tax=Castanea mollissima TaxID=60419 RepID=A0A8J4S179_9ROSI|nr:hypothetical protein CMV_002866 [Castanea mollissima]
MITRILSMQFIHWMALKENLKVKTLSVFPCPENIITPDDVRNMWHIAKNFYIKVDDVFHVNIRWRQGY